jgi:hypothetical protein
MGPALWILSGVLLLAVFYVFTPFILQSWLHWRRGRLVTCPGTRADAIIHVDAIRAALREPFSDGEPKLRVTACSEWPWRKGCDQGCVNHRN